MVWYKDNSNLTLEKDRHQIYQTSKVFQLSIKKVQKSDNGTYRCEATSAFGKDRKEFHLRVEGNTNECHLSAYQQKLA